MGINDDMEYVHGLFEGHGVKASPNHAFTLQNGAEKLSQYFGNVTRHDYQDALEVTNVEDMADYVYSLTGMSGLREISRGTLVEVLRENMVGGVLRVPKEYGMFECGKYFGEK